MVAADKAACALVAFLAVVGHVYHHGIAVLVQAYYAVNDGVVVQRGIVVVGEHAALPQVKLRP